MSSVGKCKEWQKGPIVLNDWVVLTIEQIDAKPSFQFWASMTFRRCSNERGMLRVQHTERDGSLQRRPMVESHGHETYWDIGLRTK